MAGRWVASSSSVGTACLFCKMEVTEMEGGGGCTTMSMYSTLLSHTLKDGAVIAFMFCVYYHNLKKFNGTGSAKTATWPGAGGRRAFSQATQCPVLSGGRWGAWLGCEQQGQTSRQERAFRGRRVHWGFF